MNDNLRQFVFGLVVLVLGAGLEELLPKCLGVGFPVLLTMVQALAVSGVSLPAVILLASVGGALEDAICALPFLASVSYFIAVALTVRGFALPRLTVGVTYPLFQIWLAIWTSGAAAGIFGRLLLSIPFGALTALSIGTAVVYLARKGAIHETE